MLCNYVRAVFVGVLFTDEELLLELPLLRLGTDGATEIEAGGDIVRSAVGAPSMLPNNSANTAIKDQT